MIKSVFAKWCIEAGVGVSWQKSKTNSFFEIGWKNVSLTLSLSPHRTDDICQLLLITSEVIVVSQKHV